MDESLIKYECEYFNPNLNKITFGQIGDDKLTTFEFCEEIAKTLKIGFAATDGCKDVSDAKWRQAYSERLRDFIYDQVKCGGLDEESIFDCWIDLFGYLVLVNFNYVMHYKANLDNYSIFSIFHSSNPSSFSSTESSASLNISFRSYTSILYPNTL
mgnify:CR=1 FL=1